MKSKSFTIWKTKVITFLISLPKSNAEFEKEKSSIINRLKKLRSDWVASFLTDLYGFSRRWNIDLPKEIIPDAKDIEEWLKRGRE